MPRRTAVPVAMLLTATVLWPTAANAAAGWWSSDGDTLPWATSSGVHLAQGFEDGSEGAFDSTREHRMDASQPYRSTASAAGGVPGPPSGPGGFTDTAGSVHAVPIAALVEAGITQGYPDGSFRPQTFITRGQMATFLDQALDFPDGDPNAFVDANDSVHRNAIGALIDAGITQGFADGSFRPQTSFTRGQMATFLDQALDLPDGDPSAFVDANDSVHRNAIGALMDAGITQGFADGTFRPETPVTRGQMATFLYRAFDL